MSRIGRLTERAITFAVAEPNEDLTVARLAFLAHGDHAAPDVAIDACLARPDRTLYTTGGRSGSCPCFTIRHHVTNEADSQNAGVLARWKVRLVAAQTTVVRGIAAAPPAARTGCVT